MSLLYKYKLMESTIESIGSEKRLKLCVLGNTAVGKTSLINRFLSENYQVDNERTVEEQYNKNIKLKGEDCVLQITDTGGLEEYQKSLDIWINSSEGFLLVYSINEKESFEGVKLRYEKIVKYKKQKKFSVIIVGTKCDLEEERVIKKEDVNDFCTENDLESFEISTLKDNNNDNENNKIEEIFLDIAGKIYKNKFVLKPKEPEGNCCRFC